MRKYIVASCKDWHRPMFDEFSAMLPGQWEYVSTTDELLRAIGSDGVRYVFFLHWSWIVPPEIFQRYECICFHMTDVPYGRGGSPLQNLIAAGQIETKVSALQMVEELDAGPVYAKRDMNLSGRAEDIYLRAGRLSWEIIRSMVFNELLASPQEGPVTSFKRRKPEQSEMPRSGSLGEIHDHIRMLDAPTYPLAYITYGEFNLVFTHAEVSDGEIHAKVVIRKRM